MPDYMCHSETFPVIIENGEITLKKYRIPIYSVWRVVDNRNGYVRLKRLMLDRFFRRVLSDFEIEISEDKLRKCFSIYERTENNGKTRSDKESQISLE